MGALDRILGWIGLARLSRAVDAEANAAELWCKLNTANAECAKLMTAIVQRATHAAAIPKSKISGAQLRRMNEKYNALVAQEQEPKSVSEILKEQANG